MRHARVRTAQNIPTDEPANWLRRVRAARDDPTARILKEYAPDSATITYHVTFPGLGPVWLKEYRMTLKRKILSPFRRSRAQRAWDISKRLVQTGECFPQSLLLVEEYLFGFMASAFLITEWLEDRISLADWFRLKKKHGETTDQCVQATVSDAIRLVARFHTRGVIHGDLKWSNFLLPMGADGPIVLVDLDAATLSCNPVARGKDLARFAISALQEGMPLDVCERILEDYKTFLNPPSMDETRKALFRYVQSKLPGTFA